MNNHKIVLNGFFAGRTSKRYNEDIDEIGLDAMAWELYKQWAGDYPDKDLDVCANNAYKTAQYFLQHMNERKNERQGMNWQPIGELWSTRAYEMGGLFLLGNLECSTFYGFDVVSFREFVFENGDAAIVMHSTQRIDEIANEPQHVQERFQKRFPHATHFCIIEPPTEA